MTTASTYPGLSAEEINEEEDVEEEVEDVEETAAAAVGKNMARVMSMMMAMICLVVARAVEDTDTLFLAVSHSCSAMDRKPCSVESVR